MQIAPAEMFHRKHSHEIWGHLPTFPGASQVALQAFPGLLLLGKRRTEAGREPEKSHRESKFPMETVGVVCGMLFFVVVIPR